MSPRGKPPSYFKCFCLLLPSALLLIFFVIFFDDIFKVVDDRVLLDPLPWNSSSLPKSSSPSAMNMTEYAYILQRVESKNHWVILAMADASCKDMAVNFYLTSLKRHQILNYLIVAIDNVTCPYLHQYSINCFQYTSDKDAAQSSLYLDEDFLRKMNIRTYMIIDALNLGYNVLHTDIDVYFMKNPFAGYACDESKCEIAALWDGGEYNAGFLYIRNTRGTRAVYAETKRIVERNSKINDQDALNHAIYTLRRQYGLRALQLRSELFPNGLIYWEKRTHEFGMNPMCNKCIVIHNNWMVSMEAKRYRFKESLMWLYDGSAGYYTNTKRKYLTYDQMDVPAQNQAETDMKELQNALAIAQVLNRTLILPAFRCRQMEKPYPCSLLHKLLIVSFEQNFPNYREHVFLSHPLVPGAVRENVSPLYIIEGSPTPKINNLVVLKPDHVGVGATSKEIYDWLGNSPYSVLRFANMINAFAGFSDENEWKVFVAKIKGSFKKGNYRQFMKEEKKISSKG